MPGVVVVAECLERTGSHSSTVKRRIERVTDARGLVYFSVMELFSCDWVVYRASKAGYTVVSEWALADSSSTDGVNLGFSLERDENLRMHYIKTSFPGTKPRSFIIKDGRKTVDAEGNYRSAFAAFHCSRRVARSPQEKAMLRKLYCPWLIELEDSLSAEDRRRLHDSKVQSGCTNALWVPFREVAAHIFKTDPEEVRRFCAETKSQPNTR